MKILFNPLLTVLLIICFALTVALARSRRCSPREEYNDCANDDCGRRCKDIGRVVGCTKQCFPGCSCKPGYYRTELGKCVPRWMCRRERTSAVANYAEEDFECTPAEEYRLCGRECGRRCEDIKEPVYCSLQCREGCFCKRGPPGRPNEDLYRNKWGQCVPRASCFKY